MKTDIDRVTKLLTDTVTLLCKNGLTFDRELKIQGLLAITLDAADVFVVQIYETCESPTTSQSNEKSLSNAEKSSADKQAPQKRVTPTMTRPSEEVVDLTRLAETPLAETLLGHSRNINHPLPLPVNSASTVMRSHALSATNSTHMSRGLGFPIGSCWPMSTSQSLDMSGINRFPNTMPPQNYGFGVRDEVFAASSSVKAPPDYWANTRQPNPGGFCCSLPANKPSRDPCVPAYRWPHNSSFAIPSAAPNNVQLRALGPRHTSQRGLEKLQYATDAVPSFVGTAADGNFRGSVHVPRYRQPAQTTLKAPALFPSERHASQADSLIRCAGRPRDAGLSQFIVSCLAAGTSKSSNSVTSLAGVRDSSSFACVTSSSFVGVASCAGKQSAPFIKPCLSPVPESSNSRTLGSSEAVLPSTRSTRSVSESLPCTDPPDQLIKSFQSTSGSVECNAELDRRSLSLVNPVSESSGHGSSSIDRVCSPVSVSTNDVAMPVSHGSSSPKANPETIPAYAAIVTIVPDEAYVVDDPASLPQSEDLPDVKLPNTSEGNGCNTLETGKAAQEITEASGQVGTQDSLMPETAPGITHISATQAMGDMLSEAHVNIKVQRSEPRAIPSNNCPVTSGKDSEAGSVQVSDNVEELTQQLETGITSQIDVMEDLPILTKVVISETSKKTSKRKLASDEVVLTAGDSVCSSDLKRMPKLLKCTNWSHEDEEQEDEEQEEEEADPCTSLDSIDVVEGVNLQTEGSVDQLNCATARKKRTLNCPTGRSQFIGITAGLTTGEIDHAFGEGSLGIGVSAQPCEAEDLTCASSDNHLGVAKQFEMSDDRSKASNHLSVSTSLSSIASVHPPEVTDNTTIESENPSEALLCRSEFSDPPLLDSDDPSDLVRSAAAIFSCRSKDCAMTYKIASDLAFHYVYQHPELIARDFSCGNQKSRKCPVAGNVYAKSLRASTASKREYSEQTRGLRDPSLVRSCMTTGNFVRHRPKNFRCPKVGCMKKYSSEKHLSNHLQIFHHKRPTNLGQVDSSNLRSNSEMDSPVVADNLEVNSFHRLKGRNFSCPKARCRKKYSSQKYLSNHLQIFHCKRPTNLRQVDSSNLRSNSEMDSPVVADNLEVNSFHRLKGRNFSCPKARCRKKYSSQKYLSNHLQIFHCKRPANLRQVDSSNLRSNNKMGASVAADNWVRLNDHNFLCPTAGCRKKYSSQKRLSNHLQMCHRKHPTNLRQGDSSNLRNNSKMGASVATDNWVRLNDHNFPCPTAGCRKKYSSQKRLSIHFQMFHRKRPTNLGEVNSSKLRSNSEMDSSVVADNWEVNSSNRLSCGRDSELEKTVEQSSLEN